MSNLALNDVSLSFEMHPTPSKPLNLDQTVDEEESISDDESLDQHVDGARRTFQPYGHYMINQADTNTMWVSSATSVRPHLELNISLNDNSSMMRRDSSSRRGRRPVRSKSLRFGLKEVPRKDVSPSKSPRRSRRRRSIE
jgi:hypothetical protein